MALNLFIKHVFLRTSWALHTISSPTAQEDRGTTEAGQDSVRRALVGTSTALWSTGEGHPSQGFRPRRLDPVILARASGVTREMHWIYFYLRKGQGACPQLVNLQPVHFTVHYVN